MPRKQIKRRRGVTNLLEAVTCVTIFGMLMVLLLSIMSMVSGWSKTSQDAAMKSIDTDYFITTALCDIKSADSIEIIDYNLHLASTENLVVYKVLSDTLYRNNEVVFHDVLSYMFVPGDEDVVGIYIKMKSGENIDVTIRR